MADTVTVTKILDTAKYCEYEFTNESDGTGESSVTKINLDDLVGDNSQLTGGKRPQSLSYLKATWEVSGFNYVLVEWERPAGNATCEVLTNLGGDDYYSTNPKHDPKRDLGGTGNILFTTDGGSDGSSYHIRILFKKKY